MRIGLDFDNTIACYDKAILKLSEGIENLPSKISRTKSGISNYLRTEGRESEWTVFQGELYGPGMKYAEPFNGAVATMQELVDLGHELIIVSHRSRTPYAGKPHDLHAAARRWIKYNLQKEGLFKTHTETENIHFLESLKAKISTISSLSCDAFIDDLPKVLLDSGLHMNMGKILFDPSVEKKQFASKKMARIFSWTELPLVINQLCA